ncbi:MAG: peptidyl-prolyl cis-trans isomerase [Candidatus Latescibacterota bacterium]
MLVLMLMILATGCSRSQEGGEFSEKAFVTVNDARLTESGLKSLVPSDFYGQLTADHKKEIINEWVNSELLFQDALRKKLDADPEIRAIIENTRRTLLINELLERKLGELKIPDAGELRKYYEEHKRNFVLQEKEYRARFAAFDSKRDADDFWRQVKSRGGFSELALERAKNTSAQKGGDMGIVNQESIAAEIWQSIENTVKRYGLVKISDPFAVGDQWGCVIVDEIFEPGNAKPYEAVQDQVLEMYMTEKRDNAKSEFLKKLASDAKITYRFDTEGGK